MNTDDTIESRLTSGLDRIATATPVREPGSFDPDSVPIAVDDGHPPRRIGLLLVAAAVVAVTVTGLVAIANRAGDNTGSDTTDGPTATAPAAGRRFQFVTPTVRLDADTVEVITPSGTFVPTADVDVEGDPGMPDEYTTLELTWHEGVEQRINVYFASDGTTWWVSEIRTYDGQDPGDWFEPITTGRLFERPLGTAYTGDIDLPNLHVTGMTLQAFVAPSACQASTGPVAVIADYPTIDGFTPNGGFGATFQVVDTATCTPLPIADYTFRYAVDDPAVAVVTETEPITESPADTTIGTALGDGATTTTRVPFDAIKARVGLSFPGTGATTLHVTVTDRSGTTIATLDVPITVTAAPVPVATTAVPSTTTA
ncbi:MAG: hypothetical protein QM733_03830 [Ilumatobacteraceae bacterium]